MNYISYIRKNEELIKREPVKAIPFDRINKSSFDNISDLIFEDAYNEIKHNEDISRDNIFHEVGNHNLPKALMMILLWGGAFPSNINRVLKEGELDGKLERTYNLINGTDGEQCDVEKAFKLMLGESKYNNDEENNRIEGIGVSFLTKVLFFFDNSKKGKKALIFDKWSQLEHCALIIASNEVLGDFYHIIPTKRSIKITSYRKDIYYLYDNYMTRMRSIASDLGMDDIGKLEEFLFGYSLGSMEDKKCQQHDKIQHVVDSSNPRRFLFNYLKNHLNQSDVANN